MNTSNRFEWARPLPSGKPGSVRGFLSLEEDANGLPVLRVEVDDPEYSGTLDHRTLFDLVTAIALKVSKAP